MTSTNTRDRSPGISRPQDRLMRRHGQLRWTFLLVLACAGQSQAAHPAHDQPKEPIPHQETQATEHSLLVTAFAYTADSGQTDDSEDIGAWGDELDKKVQSIAVSRDLLALGLKRGSKVRIRGLPGEYVVLDLMNPRWKKSIDIFMHKKKQARRWGRRHVHITWVTGKKPTAKPRTPPGVRKINGSSAGHP